MIVGLLIEAFVGLILLMIGLVIKRTSKKKNAGNVLIITGIIMFIIGIALFSYLHFGLHKPLYSNSQSLYY